MAVSDGRAAAPTSPVGRGWGAFAYKHSRRWLFLIHRWVGVAAALFCAMWFFSGVVMMYVPFPGLSDADRMAFLEPLDWRGVKVSPDAAMATAKLKTWPDSLKLTMLAGEPVWRMAVGKTRFAVSASDGRTLAPTTPEQALSIVKRLRPDATGATVTTVVRDQWFVAQGFDPHLPLQRVDRNDAKGTRLYVSSRTGRVLNDTVASERFWNWLGSVPHWLYFTFIRQEGEVWRQVVMWTSGPAIVGAVTGVWVGLLRVRMKRRYSQGRMTPYRGWMNWHHIAGLLAGLFVVTWLFSGWLSVNPFKWFERTPSSKAGSVAYMGQPGATPTKAAPRFSSDAAPFARLPSGDAREARLVWFAGRPLVVTMDRSLREATFDAATGAPVALTDAEIFAAAARLVPEGRVISAERLTAEDDYWYSHHTQRRLPVLRVKFADPARTWVHIDPTTGEVLGRTNASGRTYRWLFNALHDFDLRFLLHHRPLWDTIVLALSAGGLIISVSGVVIGWRRLKRKVASWVA
ncbi:PepSY domain-containing protein [soil metagenome]